jgi:hypothetical protein
MFLRLRATGETKNKYKFGKYTRISVERWKRKRGFDLFLQHEKIRK